MALWHFALGAAGILALSSGLSILLRRAARGGTAAIDAAWENVASQASQLGLTRTDPFTLEGELGGCRVHVTGQRRVAVGTARATWITVQLPAPLPFELVLRSRTGRDTRRVDWQPDWLAHVSTNDDAAARTLTARISVDLHPLMLAYAAPGKGGAAAGGYRELVVEQSTVTIELPYDASGNQVRDALSAATSLARSLAAAQGAPSST